LGVYAASEAGEVAAPEQPPKEAREATYMRMGREFEKLRSCQAGGAS